MIEVWQRIWVDNAFQIEPWRVQQQIAGGSGPEPWQQRGIVEQTTPVDQWQRCRVGVPVTELWQRQRTSPV